MKGVTNNGSLGTPLRKIGNSLGIVLPKEAVQALNVEEGATLYITESSESALRLTAEQENFDEMMDVAERGMRKYRNALRKLAQ